MKFKIGDKIKWKWGDVTRTVSEIRDTGYTTVDGDEEFYSENSNDAFLENWEKV